VGTPRAYVQNVDPGRPPEIVPTSRPHISRNARWRGRIARKAARLTRSPKALVVIGALGSIVLAWVIVSATQ